MGERLIGCYFCRSSISIKDHSGKENLVADFLSRVANIDDLLAVEDQFPDEQTFVVAVKVPWYADVV